METERDRGEWLTLACVHQIKLFGWGGKKLTSERKNNKIKVSFCADLLEDIFYEMYLTKRE